VWPPPLFPIARCIAAASFFLTGDAAFSPPPLYTSRVAFHSDMTSPLLEESGAALPFYTLPHRLFVSFLEVCQRSVFWPSFQASPKLVHEKSGVTLSFLFEPLRYLRKRIFVVTFCFSFYDHAPTWQGSPDILISLFF